jgi:hypothetical protein
MVRGQLVLHADHGGRMNGSMLTRVVRLRVGTLGATVRCSESDT